MEQGSLKKTQTPGPRPRRAPINLYGIKMTAYKHLYYGVGLPLPRLVEIWAGSVIPLSPDDVALRLYIGFEVFSPGWRYSRPTSVSIANPTRGLFGQR